MKNPTIRDEIRQLASGIRELRSFGWVVGVAFVVFWLILWGPLPYLIGKGGNFPVLWIIGAVLAVLGTVAPIVLKPLYYAWMSLALTLGFVMTRVILTIFFFVVLTPVGLVFRIIGRDALARKLDRGAESYWLDKEYPIADRTRFEKFF